MPTRRPISTQTYGLALGAEIGCDTSGLLKGDFKTQIETALRGAGVPVLKPNEARVIVGFEPVRDDPEMDRVQLGAALSEGEQTGLDDDRPRAGETPTDDGATDAEGESSMMPLDDRTKSGPRPDYRTKTARFKMPMDDDDYTVRGILATSRVDLDGERIRPEALTRWSTEWKGERLHMFREHNRAITLGEWNRLEVRDMEGDANEVELYAEGELYAELHAVQDAKALMKRGMLEGISVGMRIGDVHFTPDAIELGWVDIREASLVTFGANEDAHRMGENAFHVKRADGAIDGRAFEGLLALTDLNLEERDAVLHALADRRSAQSELDSELALWRKLQCA